MSAHYTPVGWTRNKLLYDAILLVAVAVYILFSLRLAPLLPGAGRPVDDAVLRIQAYGSCAFLLLTIVLCIGPLARLDTRFLPLLYNRRHFGVITCAVALAHASAVLGWYFSASSTDPYVALFSSNTSYGQVLGFPFELLGVGALLILVVMAATSHDFWLQFLTPPLWKSLHMSVYAAYGLVVGHVALGAMQSGFGRIFDMVMLGSTMLVAGLHIAAGRREVAKDLNAPAAATAWVDAGEADRIMPGRAIVVSLPGDERVAIFRNKDKLSAVSNLCAHQNGPLGEGRIINGCITCPWHGFQYRPEDGCAPPPYTEKLATYRLKLEGTRVFVDPVANPRGTRVEPLPVPAVVP
jgi:nitrite reductase/ring-hydroxylating ferredoxin subunit/DMSO/TMAO reductase YedYZ heme-binding membrane subunit